MAKILYLLLVFLGGYAVSPGASAAAQDVNSCEIDLIEETQTCDEFENLYIIFDDGTALLEVNLSPRHEYQRVRFDVHYNAAPEGWTVNIGDSSTNDGYGGDWSTQSNDAELQLLGDMLTLYGNDYTPTAYGVADNMRQLFQHPQFMGESRDLTLEIGDGSVYIENGADVKGLLMLPYLFALGGQSDEEGEPNYAFYAGFNRTIADLRRNGSGVAQVTVTFLRSDRSDVEDIADCGGLPSRLTVGQSAQVSPDQISALYAGPTSMSGRLEELPGGSPIKVIAGPICQGENLWWFVSGDSDFGWTMESSGYLLEPADP